MPLYLLLCLFISSTNISARIDCPTWYSPIGNDSEKCSCGDTIDGRIKCQPNGRVSIWKGNCMTYTGNQTLFGTCSFVSSNLMATVDDFITLPQNVSELNEFMCGWMNRTGLLCSQCDPGLSLAALSYKKQCIKCSHLV